MPGGSRRPPLPRFWPPPADVVTVLIVIAIEGPPQCGLFIQHDKHVGREEEQPRIADQRNRLIKQRGARQSEAGAEIHRIPDEPIWASNHKPTWRIERRRGPAADECERQDARDGECSAHRCQEHSSDLPRADGRRSTDACCGQDPAGQKYEEEAYEKRRIRHRANEDEHH